MEGKDGASRESITFLQIPKLLFTDERFRSVSNSGKLLYGILLDRNSLSVSNGWKDEQKRVYVYCTVDNVAELLGCSNKKARTMLEGKCVCCCVCGKLLQKSSLCNTEIRCWGCGTFLSVYVNRGIVVVASKGIEEKISLFDKMDMMLSN